MYPLQFRPNGLCEVFTPGGVSLATNVDLQIMRPMLGLRFNQLNPDLDFFAQAGGVVLRFVLQNQDFANLFVGPPHWRMPSFPFFLRNEDFNFDPWYVLDAVPWDDPLGGDQLLAGFASKKMAVKDAAVPIAAVALAMADNNPIVDLGVTYSAHIIRSTQNWYRFPCIAGQCVGAQITTRTAGGANMTLKIMGGSPIVPVALMTSGAAAEAVYTLTTFVSSTGPWQWLEIISNDAAIDKDYEFVVSRSRQGNLPS